jgi:hypothetical protein
VPLRSRISSRASAPRCLTRRGTTSMPPGHIRGPALRHSAQIEHGPGESGLPSGKVGSLASALHTPAEAKPTLPVISEGVRFLVADSDFYGRCAAAWFPSRADDAARVLRATAEFAIVHRGRARAHRLGLTVGPVWPDGAGETVTKLLDAGTRLRVGQSIADFDMYSHSAYLILLDARRLCADAHALPELSFGICPSPCETVFERTRSDRRFCDQCSEPQNRPRFLHPAQLPAHLHDQHVERVGGEVRVRWLGRCLACGSDFERHSRAKGATPTLCAGCSTPTNRQRRKRGQKLEHPIYRFDACGVTRWRCIAGSQPVLHALSHDGLSVFETRDAEIAAELRRHGFSELSVSGKQ